MPRDRQRLTLESGPKLDLAKLIPSGAGKPGSHIQCVLTYGSGETITATLRLQSMVGSWSYPAGNANNLSLWCRIRGISAACNGTLSAQRPDGGCGCSIRPLGATFFASRYAWGRRAAYASQFLDPIGRAWRTKAKVKTRLLGNEDPNEWDLPPKPKGMRWATYERWVAKYDAAEEALNAQLVTAAARLMERL